jgi:hypothetical protein
MEKELLSEQIRISPTLKKRLDRMARHRDTYEDVIKKAVNYYEACNNPVMRDDVNNIAIRFSMPYQQVYFIWLEKNLDMDLTIKEILDIKRNEVMLKDIVNHPVNLDYLPDVKDKKGKECENNETVGN